MEDKLPTLRVRPVPSFPATAGLAAAGESGGMLEQHDSDTGSASSLIQATFVLTGSIGMLIVSREWIDRILVLGAMTVTLGLAGLALWIYTKTRCRVPKHFI